MFKLWTECHRFYFEPVICIRFSSMGSPLTSRNSSLRIFSWAPRLSRHWSRRQSCTDIYILYTRQDEITYKRKLTLILPNIWSNWSVCKSVADDDIWLLNRSMTSSKWSFTHAHSQLFFSLYIAYSIWVCLVPYMYPLYTMWKCVWHIHDVDKPTIFLCTYILYI